jgi:hypothetical protein
MMMRRRIVIYTHQALLSNAQIIVIYTQQMRTQNFSWGGGGEADPEAIYNLFFILKFML